MKLSIEFFTALLTPLIAIIASYIAFQQYRMAKSKLRHDVYERRLKVYKAAKEYLYWARTSQSEDDHREENPREEFRIAIADSQFLFDEELSEWLHEIEGRKDYLYGNLNSEQLKKLKVDREWFSQRDKELADKFMKYLSLKNLR